MLASVTTIDATDLAAATTTDASLEPLLSEIRAHAEDIARAWALGGIVVLVSGAESPDAALYALQLGRANRGPAVFRMSAAGRRKLGEGLRRNADAAGGEWCDRKGGPPRLLVIDGQSAGHLLVSYADRRLWTESGAAADEPPR